MQGRARGSAWSALFCCSLSASRHGGAVLSLCTHTPALNQHPVCLQQTLPAPPAEVLGPPPPYPALRGSYLVYGYDTPCGPPQHVCPLSTSFAILRQTHTHTHSVLPASSSPLGGHQVLQPCHFSPTERSDNSHTWSCLSRLTLLPVVLFPIYSFLVTKD